MQIIIFFTLALTAILNGCGQKESTTDSWDTPNLIFKRSQDSSDRAAVVSKESIFELQAQDEFYFQFRTDNSEKQKSIKNLKVQANCAADAQFSKDIYQESFDIGAAPSFLAQDLIPPTALYEGASEIFCQWTLVISNALGSTRSFSMNKMKLALSHLRPKVKVEDNNLQTVAPGSLLHPGNSKGLKVVTELSLVEKSVLRCDLLSITSQRGSQLLSDFIEATSDNEPLRQKHPAQRCIFEAYTAEGRIYRSAGYSIYLHPSPLLTVDLQMHDRRSQVLPVTGQVNIGRATIKNYSNQPRWIGLPTQQVPYDILMFDNYVRWIERPAPFGPEPKPPSKDSFSIYQKHDGSITVSGLNTREIKTSGNETLILVRPHEQFELSLTLIYEIKSHCSFPETATLGGLRIPLKNEILGERAAYADIKGKTIQILTLPHTQLRTTPPYDTYMGVFHGDLLYEPHKRSFNPIANNQGC